MNVHARAAVEEGVTREAALLAREAMSRAGSARLALNRSLKLFYRASGR